MQDVFGPGLRVFFQLICRRSDVLRLLFIDSCAHFSGENIGYGVLGINGDQQPPLEDIIAAAKMANAHKFTSAFPDKYDTMVRIAAAASRTLVCS